MVVLRDPDGFYLGPRLPSMLINEIDSKANTKKRVRGAIFNSYNYKPLISHSEVQCALRKHYELSQ